MLIEKGKNYRYTFECVARDDHDSDNRSIGGTLPPLQRTNIKVEEIEPPVKVFKSGDLVRHKGTHNVYLLTDDAAIMVKAGDEHDAGSVGKSYHHNQHVFESVFTSRAYAKVEIGTPVDNEEFDW